MSDFPTILPAVNETRITTVIDHLRLLTLGKGADVITPIDIQTNLDSLSAWYPDDATTQLVLDDIWRKVNDMHTTTGQAVTWIAVQHALIEDLHHQRDTTVDEGTLVSEILADQAEILHDAFSVCGCGPEAVDLFLQVFCDHPEDLPDLAKQLIRQAVHLVYTHEMEELENVN